MSWAVLARLFFLLHARRIIFLRLFLAPSAAPCSILLQHVDIARYGGTAVWLLHSLLCFLYRLIRTAAACCHDLQLPSAHTVTTGSCACITSHFFLINSF